MAPARGLLDRPDTVRHALSPLRRRLLHRLRTPASAVQLAAELDLPRQRLGYHLRELEAAGLVACVAQHRRRGFVERVLQATADAFVVDPALLGEPPARAGDHGAAEHLVDVAAGTVRELSRMQAAADGQGRRLLTFTLESQVRFADPADVHAFTEALATALGELVATYDSPAGRPYRLVALGHPAPAATPAPDAPTATPGGPA